MIQEKIKRLDEKYCQAKESIPEGYELLIQAKEYDVLVREWFTFLNEWKEYLPNKVIEQIDRRVSQLQTDFYKVMEEAEQQKEQEQYDFAERILMNPERLTDEEIWRDITGEIPLEDSENPTHISQRWRAEKGDGYYFIADTGETKWTKEIWSEVDDLRYTLGNYFEEESSTQQAAEGMMEFFNMFHKTHSV